MEKQAIDNFLKSKSIAVIGVSRNKKFGNLAYRELKSKGYKVFAVNPNMESMEGDKCYPSLKTIPEKVDGVFIAVGKDKSQQAVQSAVELGIKNIWLQQGAESEAAISLCKKESINCIHGKCILLYTGATGFPHNLHRSIAKLTGKYSK